jgi:iron complex outermembrane receptor protein
MAYTDTTLIEGVLQNIAYSNRPIAYSPNFTAQGHATWMPITGIEASILARYIGKQYLDNRGLDNFSLPAYGLADLKIAYQIKPRKIAHTLQINLQINNVLNAKYSNNGYVYADYVYIYPQARRNFLAGLVISL